MPIIHEEPFPVVPEADRETTNYTPVYIDNTHGVLDIEGYVPKEAILDTGATKVMIPVGSAIRPDHSNWVFTC